MRSRVVILLALVLLVLSTRLLPLAISQYPFNNDGITECRIAGDILTSGHLSFPEDAFYLGTHSTITPIYNILLSYVSASCGVAPFDVAQITVAFASLIVVVGSYILSYAATESRKAAISVALTLSLFGTFVFLTGSTWKESLALALLILFLIAYVARSQRNMLILEIVTLMLIPFTHHLVNFITFLLILYLTVWAFAFGLRRRNLCKRHYLDLAILSVPLVLSIAFYSRNGFDRLSYLTELTDGLKLAMIVMALSFAGFFALTRRGKARLAWAILPGLLVYLLFVWDYFNPIFSYVPGAPQFTLLIGAISGILLSVSWHGLGICIKSDSMYRAIPLGLLVSVSTLLLFAFIDLSSQSSLQIIYRSYDFADVAIAMGVGCVVAYMGNRVRRQLFFVLFLILILLISFPFGYLSESLIGVRHDTQAYEVDALEWADVHIGSSFILQTDERMAYNARALYDFAKSPGLPIVLDAGESPNPESYCLYIEEWASKGVSAFPYGYITLNDSLVHNLIQQSNTYFVGGPDTNNLVIFRAVYPAWLEGNL